MNFGQQTLDRAPTTDAQASPARRTHALPALLQSLRARSVQRRIDSDRTRAADAALERSARRDLQRAARRARSREFGAYPATRGVASTILPITE